MASALLAISLKSKRGNFCLASFTMGCDQCWPGNCTGACDPKEQVKNLRLLAEQYRRSGAAQMQQARWAESEAAKIEETLKRGNGD